jgi:hypothetical protein
MCLSEIFEGGVSKYLDVMNETENVEVEGVVAIYDFALQPVNKESENPSLNILENDGLMSTMEFRYGMIVIRTYFQKDILIDEVRDRLFSYKKLYSGNISVNEHQGIGEKNGSLDDPSDRSRTMISPSCHRIKISEM